MLKYEFLGAFGKLRKATISFVMSSVRPSVRMEQLGSHWTILMKFDIEVFLKNL
jgi:hypothetical protein